MDINKCKELIEKNYSYTAIAKELNMAVTTVKRKLKQLGLKTKHNPVARVNLNIDDVKKLVNEHYSSYDIAKKLNTSQTNVRYWLKKLKLKTDKMSQYNTYKSSSQTSYKSQKSRGATRKIFFVNQLGGKCKMCGYNKNYSALAFHHRNPSEKEFNIDIRKFSNLSIEKLQIEIDKCDLLCHNCHNELHHPNCKLNCGSSVQSSTEPLVYETNALETKG